MADYLFFDAGQHANIGETAAVIAIDDDLVNLDDIEVDDTEMPEEIDNQDHCLIYCLCYRQFRLLFSTLPAICESLTRILLKPSPFRRVESLFFELPWITSFDGWTFEVRLYYI